MAATEFATEDGRDQAKRDRAAALMAEWDVDADVIDLRERQEVRSS